MKFSNTIFAVLILMCVLHACTKKTVPSAAVPANEKPVNGALLFTNFCQRCHGETGKAPRLEKFAGSRQDALYLIKHGGGAMPAFEDKLSSREMEALADFVLTLKK